MKMRAFIFLLFSLAVLVDAQADVLDDLKTGYCYAFFSMELQNSNLTEEKVAQLKMFSDKLFPRYRAALDHARGRLTETALEMEADKARHNQERKLSAAEYFMIVESCERQAAQ
jgi:hypothetical protein